MAKRLAVPKQLEHLLEKRERDRRAKRATRAKPAMNERRKDDRRKAD